MAIVACSTPPGVSGIAVVRISGEDAIKNVSTFVKDSPLNEVKEPEKIDESDKTQTARTFRHQVTMFSALNSLKHSSKLVREKVFLWLR